MTPRGLEVKSLRGAEKLVNPGFVKNTPIKI